VSDGPVLVIERLTRRFGAREVVRDFDLALRPGDRAALCGPNGSGKTTIIRCIAGTLTPTEGRIRIMGYPAGSLEARRHVGVSLSQERSFYFRLSGRENLLFFARVRGYGKRESTTMVQAIEEELELSAILDRRVDQYSTGMVQQLAFARALLGSPALLLLDEPTRSLDAEAISRLWAAIGRRPNLALLIATHRADDVEHCGTRRDLGSPQAVGR